MAFIGSPIFQWLIKFFMFSSLTSIIYVMADYPISETQSAGDYAWLSISSVLLGCLLWFLHIKFFNQQLDSKVREVLQRKKEDHDSPIALYLRPFSTDGKIFLRTGLIDTLKLFVSMNLIGNGNFEARLLKKIYKKYVPIRFDEKVEKRSFKEIFKMFDRIDAYRFGTYIQSTSDNWFELVRKTISKSTICIVVPPLSLESSTAKEITRLLKRGYAEKTVFIMPPENVYLPIWKTMYRTADGVKISLREVWSNLLKICDGYIELPAYSKKGGFVLPVNGNHRLIDSCGGANWWNNRAIKSIFLKGNLTTSPIQESLFAAFWLAWLIPLLTTVAWFGSTGSVIVFYEIDIENIGLHPSVYLIALVLPLLSLLVFNYQYSKKFLLSNVGSILLSIAPIAAFFLAVLLYGYVADSNSSIELFRLLGSSSEAKEANINGEREVLVLFISCTAYIFTALIAYITLRSRRELIFEAAAFKG